MNVTDTTVQDFLETVEPNRIEDIKKLLEIGEKLTGKKPKMWGSIVGFGSLHYVYKTGHQGDMPEFGFANRKQALTLYVSYDLEAIEELKDLGKYKIGKSCLYIKKLDDVNLDVLETVILKGLKETENYDFITDNEA